MSGKTCKSAIDVLLATNFPFNWSLTDLAISPTLAELLAQSYANRDGGAPDEWLASIHDEQKVAS